MATRVYALRTLGGVPRGKVRYDNQWGRPLCLIGDSGTGKSHLPIALGTEAATAGYRVCCTLATKRSLALLYRVKKARGRAVYGADGAVWPGPAVHCDTKAARASWKPGNVLRTTRERGLQPRCSIATVEQHMSGQRRATPRPTPRLALILPGLNPRHQGE